MLYPPFKKLRKSVRPSVHQRIIFTLCWEHFLTNFLQTFRVDIGKECLGLQMG